MKLPQILLPVNLLHEARHLSPMYSVRLICYFALEKDFPFFVTIFAISVPSGARKEGAQLFMC